MDSDRLKEKQSNGRRHSPAVPRLGVQWTNFMLASVGRWSFLPNLSMSLRTRLLVLLFPLVFFTVNRTWMYPVLDHPDSWIYTGYFLHPELLYQHFPSAYYGARVLHTFWPWLALRSLPLEAALLIYKGSLFYLGYLFLFGALNQLFKNCRAAFLGAALGLTQGHAIYSLSWNYVGSTCLVLLLGNIWAQAHLRQAVRLWWWQMLAGAFYVGAICTYLLLPLVAPMVFALFAYGLPRWTWRELFNGVGWAAAGGVMVILLQGGMSMAMGGPFWFLGAQLNKAQTFAGEDWFLPFATWWAEAVWLPYFGLILILALLGIWKGGFYPDESGHVNPERVDRRLAGPLPYVSFVYLVGLALFLAYNALGIWPMLQNYFLSSFLLPFSFLVMGGWLAWLLHGLAPFRQWLVVFAALVAVLLTYTVGDYAWLKNGAQTWAMGFIGTTVAACLMTGRSQMLAAGIFACSLAGLNISLSPPQLLSPSLLNRYIIQNQALYTTVRWLEPWDRDGQLWFWYGLDRPNGRFHKFIDYFYGWWGNSVLGERFPGLVGGIVHRQEPYSARAFKLQPGMRVVLFDPTNEELASIQSSLGEKGLQLKLLAKLATPIGAAIPAMDIELWQAEPTGDTHGIAMAASSAKLAAGVQMDPSANGATFHYPAGLKGAALVYGLPDPIMAEASQAALCHVLIGGDPRALRMQFTDEHHQMVAETIIDGGLAVRDWWLTIPPGTKPRYLEIGPLNAGPSNTFIVQSVEF